MATKKTIQVSAVDGAQVPLEHNPRRYVTGTMKVPATSYYRRAILRGTLREAKASKPKPNPKPTTDRAEREEK